MNENHNNIITMKQAIHVYSEPTAFYLLPVDTSEFFCFMFVREQEGASWKCSNKLSDSFMSAGSLESELPKWK